MDDKYTVYMHRNKENGKVYIGCTKYTLAHRFDNGNGYIKCSRFWDAICEEGFDAFDHIVLHNGLSRDEAYDIEERLIDEYDAMNPEYGYNMRRGGFRNTACPEVGRRISRAKMGHEVTEETREKLRQYFGKKILQKSMNDEPIKIFNSITEAARTVGAYKPNIWAVCNGRKVSAKGYKWEYCEED